MSTQRSSPVFVRRRTRSPTVVVPARVRAIRSAEQSLRIQEESIELAERRLDLASELMRAGNAGGGGAVRRGDAREEGEPVPLGVPGPPPVMRGPIQPRARQQRGRKRK